MTLLELEILSHYRCRADDWRNGDHSAPICKETFHRFLEQGLLVPSNIEGERFSDDTIKARYTATDRCKAYLDAVCSVPLPEQKWVMPPDWTRRVADGT